MYDHTAGQIKTPSGVGKFVQFDNVSQMVIVEMDYQYLAAFKASECYPIRKEEVKCL